jgi:hypothetical protein
VSQTQYKILLTTNLSSKICPYCSFNKAFLSMNKELGSLNIDSCVAPRKISALMHITDSGNIASVVRHKLTSVRHITSLKPERNKIKE